MKLNELRQQAESGGAKLFVLQPGKKLPAFIKGKKIKDIWLCVLPETERHMIYAAVPHFSHVYVFKKEKKQDEVSE